MAGRDVPVAGQADVGVHGADHGDGVAAVLDSQLVLDAAVAVAGRRVDTGHVRERRLLDGLGRHTGDLGHLLGRVLAHALDKVLPDGLYHGGAAVFERDLELAEQRRVDLRVERRRIGHPTLGHARDQMLLHALVACRRRGPRFAFPQTRARVEVRHAVVQVVPHHELVRVAVFLEVGFLQQARLHLVSTAREAVILEAARLDIVAHQERTVRPFLGKEVVIELVVDEHVQPAHDHGAVGAGTQVQPDISFLAQVGQTRVDNDVRVGLFGDVDDRAARVVVVGELGTGTPRRVDLRAADGLHPRRLHHRIERRGKEARAFADLPRNAHVGRAGQLAQGPVCHHAPNAARTGQAEDGFATVAVDAFLHLLRDGRHGLVPRNAHPTRVVLAASVRALHGIVQTVRMVGRLQGRLTLAAMVAHGLEGALVALGTNSAAVLHNDPHTALHLAASAAARAHALGLPRRGARCVRRLGQRGGPHRGRRRDRRRRDSRQLCERATRHRKLAHASSSRISKQAHRTRLDEAGKSSAMPHVAISCDSHDAFELGF